MQEIAWGRIIPGTVVQRPDGRRFRVLALDPNTPGRVLLANPGDGGGTLDVTRDPRSMVVAGLPDDVLAIEYAARRLEATLHLPPVPNARLVQHLFRMHDVYVEPKHHKDYKLLRQWHDELHDRRQFWLAHEHRADAAR